MSRGAVRFVVATVLADQNIDIRGISGMTR
jgi:hypothetical protein